MPEMPENAAGPHGAAGGVSLRVGIGLLAAETLLMAVVVVLLVYQDLTAEAGTVTGAAGVTLFAALVAAFLGLLTWSLLRRRGWARGPAIVLQLLLVPLGWYALSGGQPVLGAPVLIAGVVGAFALLSPSTRADLDRR